MKVIILPRFCFLIGLLSSILTVTVSGTHTSLSSSSTKSSQEQDQERVPEREEDRELMPIFCGCSSGSGCDATAYDTLADDYSCGARIDWLRNTQGFSEQDACAQVAELEYPNECGTCNPQTCTASPTKNPTSAPIAANNNNPCGCSSCVDSVWNTFAGKYKCGDRIQYLQNSLGYTEQDACSKVAGLEYAAECGGCDPDRCDNNPSPAGNDSTITLSPTKSPSNLPSKAPTNAPSNVPSEVPSNAPSDVPTNSPIDSPSPPPVYPCSCSSCTDSVLNTFAGEYTCGNRIDYLRYDLGFTEEAACSEIGGIEFPSDDICGKCDPSRCIDNNEDEDNEDISQPNNNQPQNNDNNNKCGAAVNSSNDSNQKCVDDLWDPTGDNTMHCFAYGGIGDPCHLNNNNDINDGRNKDPSNCLGDTFYLWDEPDTQGKSYDWAGRTWLEYSRQFANEINEMRRSSGTKITSPMLKAGGPGTLYQNLNYFFSACGSPCYDKNDPAYIDIIAINAFCGDFNGPAGCRGGAAFIYNEAISASKSFQNIPVYITNWSRLQTNDPQDQVDAVNAIEEFFPADDGTNDDDRVVQRVYWFGATDFGGDSSNNFLTTVLADGNTLGELWRNKCKSL